MESIKTDLGGFLKMAHHVTGMKAKQVAYKAGIAESSYSTLISKSRCNTDTLKRLIEAMGEDFVIKFHGVEYHITKA